MTSGFKLKTLNPMFEAEPFQASQGDDAPTSPKDLEEFYEDMQKREIERRQSRGKSRRWSRKGSTKGDALNDTRTLKQAAQKKGYEEETNHEWEVLEQQAQAMARETPSDDTHDADDEGQSSVGDMPTDNLVPPRWSYRPPEHAAAIIAPPTSYRRSYQIHNPVGPRYYRNHHLRPFNNSAVTAAQYPPSAFSNAFPPLAALPTGSPVRGLGLGHAQLHPHNQQPFPSPGTSQSSSDSALPTPDSSQSTFMGPEAPRQRKQSAGGTVLADPVDLLDGSDPWGQKFHHDSPYDLGKKGKGAEPGNRNGTWGESSSPNGDSKPPRTRGSHTRRKTTPSPLSQSTSAIHIQSEGDDALPVHVGRKLSKRRGNGLKGLFGGSSPSDSRESTPPDADPPPMKSSASAPATPIDAGSLQQNHMLMPAPPNGLTRKLSKSRPTNASTGSIASIIPVHPPSPDKDGKRTSVFGRIAKRFSIARRPESMVPGGGRRGMFDKGKGKESVVSLTTDTEEPVGAMRRADTEPAPDTGFQQLTRPQEPRKNTDPKKRVPPPSLDPEPSSTTTVSPPPKDPPPALSQSVASSSAVPAPQPPANIQLPELVTGAGLGLLKPQEREDPRVRDSLMSVDPEAAWRLGKLTIANPDLPGGSETDLSARGDGSPRWDGGARQSPRVNGDARLPPLPPNGDAHLFMRANGDALRHESKKEPELPPVPSKEGQFFAVDKIETVEMPRASIAPPLPSKPRAPSPELPPPPKAEPPPNQFEPPAPKFEPPPPKVEPPPPKVEPPPPKVEPPPPKSDALPPRFEQPPPAAELPQSKVALSSSSTVPQRHARQQEEHEYHIDVPFDGSLYARTAPGGGSAPPVEKPTLPLLPSKSRYREPAEQQSVTAPRLRTSSKDTTIFTSIFATPSRSRHPSESSPEKSSAHGHGYEPASSSAPLQRSRGHVRTGSYSPEKPAPTIVYVRAGSESPDKEGRRERAKEKDKEREKRRERRAAERESERELEDRTRRRERERRDSSVRRGEKEESERERGRRREERARDREERERVREKERERERDKERGRQREREREREERERQKVRQREREREEREREKVRQREKGKEREKERQQEKERQREKEREREKEKEREREREKEREKERERERRKEKESRQERETEYKLVPRHRTSSLTASTSNNRMRSNSKVDVTTDEDDLAKLTALGQDWEVVESSRTRKRDRERDDRDRERGRENGYATTNAFPHRSNNSVKDSSNRTGSGRRRSEDKETRVPPETFVSFSRPGPRQRAYSLETPPSRSPSTLPPTPPEKGPEQKAKQKEDTRYSQPSSSVPAAHATNSAPRRDARSTSTPYGTQRPNSGFQSSTDLAAFKAKEAWERDRMWRGQSMTFGSDSQGGGSAASTNATVTAGAWGAASMHDQPPAIYGSGNAVNYYHQPPPAHHGSSYTSFMVQPSWSYPQYSQPPPPPAPIPPYSLQSSANPLPAPPRQSAFDTRTPP